METFRIRLAEGITEAIASAPFVACGGVLFGYVYSKLADLPPLQVVKAWAIFQVAENALIILGCAFTENFSIQAGIKATVLVTSTFSIRLLQKREIIGEKMAIFLIAFRAFGALGLVLNAAIHTPVRH
jgi:hypothetical protein